MTTKTTKTPKATAATELKTLQRQLWLQARAWRGEAASRELAGTDLADAGVSALHHCAMDLDRLLVAPAGRQR